MDDLYKLFKYMSDFKQKGEMMEEIVNLNINIIDESDEEMDNDKLIPSISNGYSNLACINDQSSQIYEELEEYDNINEPK